MTAGEYQPTDRLHLWLLSEPAKPRYVGELALIRSNQGVSLRYSAEWLEQGFPLSEDLPLLDQEFLPLERNTAAGAVDDARPGEQQYELAPAYDVLPSGQALGFQQMRVGEQAADSSLDNALSLSRLFALRKDEAVREARAVARIVSGWKEHFIACGVAAGDIEQYAAQVDRPFLLEQREEARKGTFAR